MACPYNVINIYVGPRHGVAVTLKTKPDSLPSENKSL